MSNKKRIKKLEIKKYKSTPNWNRLVQVFSEYKMGYSFVYSGGRLSGRTWRNKAYKEFVAELRKTSEFDFKKEYLNIPPIHGNEPSGMENIISPKFIDPILMKRFKI